MDDEIRMPFTIPLDDAGFLRRECPTCEQEFKWFSHAEGDADAEVVSQHFCPLCGVPAGPDSWWTTAQLEYGQGTAGPELDRFAQESFAEAFKGIKGITFESNSGFSFEIPTPKPLLEPNDMVIAESPCHPNEPIKIPEANTDHVYCLVCGTQFSV